MATESTLVRLQGSLFQSKKENLSRLWGRPVRENQHYCIFSDFLIAKQRANTVLTEKPLRILPIIKLRISATKKWGLYFKCSTCSREIRFWITCGSRSPILTCRNMTGISSRTTLSPRSALSTESNIRPQNFRAEKNSGLRSRALLLTIRKLFLRTNRRETWIQNRENK